MSDKIKGCWVAFNKDIKIDDAQLIINAIKLMQCVADVTVCITDSNDWINRAQIKSQLINKLIEILKE